MEVVAEDSHFRVLVNGKMVVDTTDENETFSAGHFALLNRGNSVVRFRNIEIKELPSK